MKQDQPEAPRQRNFAVAIDEFLKARLDAKLEKLADDDPKRDELIAQHTRPTWLADAARRVTQIQAVTHALKPMHPEARGTNLYCAPESLPPRTEVGTHVLGPHFDGDVVGNAAALDVYKLLKLEIDGHSLLHWLQAGDADALAALDDDAAIAQAWADAFTGITRPRSTSAASHPLAKQLYWMIGDDAADDRHYHLLAPLYASSLAHAVFLRIEDDRFGEAAKAARQARRDGDDHASGYRDYPGLAVQKLGGTKPQNISQLNSERRGGNYLLASLPPQWRARTLSPPLRTESVFPRFGRQPEVRKTVRELRDFLRSDPPSTLETHQRREALVDDLIDALVAYAQPLQEQLPAGWSADTDCRLDACESLWLDPGRASEEAGDAAFAADWQFMDWPADIGSRFANWLNHQLAPLLPVGDVEARQWETELLLNTGWAGQLHRQRRKAEAPTAIPTRRAR